MDQLIGTTLGPYKIVERLGEGGMAVVYKGYQESLGRYVAIKVLRGELAHDQEFIARFRREALSAARLNHPNILHVYDAGVVGATYFIAMDYADGGSLRELIAGRGLPPEQAAEIAAQLADALDHAHLQGVIHRDIKPSNILLMRDAQAAAGVRPVIADFGIARALAENTHLTRTGIFIGTPEYMAPEQAEGQPADGRSDIYALGIVLYEMLTGTVPFSAPTPAATLYKQVHQAPLPVRQTNARVPAWLETIVTRALDKRPKQRYQRAREMAGDLRRAGAGAAQATRLAAAPSAPPTVEHRRPPRPAGSRSGALVPVLVGAVVVVLLLLAAGAAFVALGNRGDKATPAASATSQVVQVVDVAPTVAIQAPAAGTIVELGQEVAIQAESKDDRGVVRVEMWADGTLVRTDSSSAPGGQAPFVTYQPWRAEVAGSHVIVIKAFDALGQAGESEPLMLLVEDRSAATEAPTPAATAEPTAQAATEVPTEAPTALSATDTATPSATPTATPSATPSATPTATRTPTPTPTPGCAVATDGELAGAWERARLGCPTGPAQVLWAAWEPFERGYMLWRSDTDWAYAFNWQNGNNPAAGQWATGGNPWRWDGSFPDGRGLAPPAGRYEPIRGFGFVWFNFLGGPGSQLGWATAEEKGFCAKIQLFDQGFIFRSNTVEYCQDQLFNWARDPSFSPLWFAVYGDGTWKSFP